LLHKVQNGSGRGGGIHPLCEMLNKESSRKITANKASDSLHHPVPPKLSASMGEKPHEIGNCALESVLTWSLSVPKPNRSCPTRQPASWLNLYLGYKWWERSYKEETQHYGKYGLQVLVINFTG